MKIIIIGGSGFIGGAITKYLINLKYEVIVFNRGNFANPNGSLQITGEKENLDLFLPQLKKIKPDAFIHTIAYTEDDALQILNTLGRVSKRILLLSSGDVYKAYTSFKDGLEEQDIILNESSALRTNYFPYRNESKNISDEIQKRLFFNYDKLVVENILKQSNLDYTIFRLGAVYGADDPQKKLQKYITDVKEGKDQILSNDQLIWKWTRIFVENIPFAIHLALHNKMSIKQIYNVGEAKAYSQLEIYELINQTRKIDQLKKPEKRRENPLDESKFNYKQHLILDSSKIRNELGYSELIDPQFALEETIKDSLTH